MEESGTLSLDRADLRDLLDLLLEKRVQSFQLGELTVVFKSDEVWQPEAGTSNRTVAGIGREVSSLEEPEMRSAPSTTPREGFKHPSLWTHQNGKVLKFDGSME